MGLQKRERRAEEYFLRTYHHLQQNHLHHRHLICVARKQKYMRKTFFFFKKLYKGKDGCLIHHSLFRFCPYHQIIIIIYPITKVSFYHNIMYSSFFSSYKDGQTAFHSHLVSLSLGFELISSKNIERRNEIRTCKKFPSSAASGPQRISSSRVLRVRASRNYSRTAPILPCSFLQTR